VARSRPHQTRLTLLGVGAMNSPRYAPAGLLVEHLDARLAIDGGPGAEPSGELDAWLVTDDKAELIGKLRRAAKERGLVAGVDTFVGPALTVVPHAVVHTSHPTFGYLISVDAHRVVWAPEFLEFPTWAAGADLMFAEAAGWNSPIRFAHGAGGHAPVVDVARDALAAGVGRLVYAHIGRPTIAALDAGHVPSFGEIGADGADYTLDDETAPCD
jgi:hypothetical protein